MTANLLNIINLTCGYDSRFSIKKIQFTLDRGKIIGIIGPNGSGKTTLLRAMTNIIKPSNGEILLNGKNIRKYGIKDLAKHIAVVSQNIDAEYFTVNEFVIFGRYPHFENYQFIETDKDNEIAGKYMKMTDTYPLKDKYFNELSGGEKQLVQIARALTQEPELLLLDEPTSHLDIKHQVRILDLVRRLNREAGITVVIVLHDLNLASEYCDELILMENGTIHNKGTPEEVLTYQAIEQVYQTIVVVEKNPVSLKPYIFLVSEEAKHLNKR